MLNVSINCRLWVLNVLINWCVMFRETGKRELGVPGNWWERVHSDVRSYWARVISVPIKCRVWMLSVPINWCVLSVPEKKCECEFSVPWNWWAYINVVFRETSDYECSMLPETGEFSVLWQSSEHKLSVHKNRWALTFCDQRNCYVW